MKNYTITVTETYMIVTVEENTMALRQQHRLREQQHLHRLR